MPEHQVNGELNPNIKIYDSHKIRDTKNQREILQIVMTDPLYDSSLFFRTENSYITEWKAHNLLYDVMFFSKYLRQKFGDADLDNNEVVAWDIRW